MERVRFSVLKCAVCDVLFFTISFSGPCILWLLFWEVAQSQGYQGYACEFRLPKWPVPGVRAGV